jgi:undecaprenyl diphosphate synthase
MKKTVQKKAHTHPPRVWCGCHNEHIILVYFIFNKKKVLNIKNFQEKLYTKNIPDPDILIRTGGTRRLSNFLLWQIAYAEIFFIDKLWPDFNEKNLCICYLP